MRFQIQLWQVTCCLLLLSSLVAATIFVAKSVSPGQQLKFGLAGEGTEPHEAQVGSVGGGEGNPGGNPGPPVGGLGTPVAAPDPPGNAPWFILGLVVVGSAGGVVRMKQCNLVAKAASPTSASFYAPAPASGSRQSETNPRQRLTFSGSMLDARKDELFALESERLEGKISQPEYETAKSGLDALFRPHTRKAG